MGRWREGVSHGSHSAETPCRKAQRIERSGMAKVIASIGRVGARV